MATRTLVALAVKSVATTVVVFGVWVVPGAAGLGTLLCESTTVLSVALLAVVQEAATKRRWASGHAAV